MTLHTYRMEESDLDEHWRDWLGRRWDPSKLGVDLCATCDSLIVNGECPSCARDAALSLTVSQLTGEPIEEKPLGDGWNRWAA